MGNFFSAESSSGFGFKKNSWFRIDSDNPTWGQFNKSESTFKTRKYAYLLLYIRLLTDECNSASSWTIARYADPLNYTYKLL